MKRFICALVLLCITVTGAALSSRKTVALCNDFLDVMQSDAPPETLVQWWDANGTWLMVLLPHAQIEDVKIMIERLPADKAVSEELYRVRRNELRHTVTVMRDAQVFNLQNIF